MDTDVVRSKLESIVRCLGRVRDRTPESVDVLREDLDTQDIIVLNLERAVQLCVDTGLHLMADGVMETPQTMAEVFLALAQADILPAENATHLAKAVGFRNIAVHQYRDIDWGVVYAILTSRLEDFRVFIDRVTRYISD